MQYSYSTKYTANGMVYIDMTLFIIIFILILVQRMFNLLQICWFQPFLTIV